MTATDPSGPEVDEISIRDATVGERAALELLQRRSSHVWEQYRDQLAAHPDAIELPEAFVVVGRVRVVDGHDEPRLGFSVVIPGENGTYELDGLFIEPERMRRGLGRALVEDACDRARRAGARSLEVVAGPAQGFYERLGFHVFSTAATRFGPAVRMRRAL